MYDPKVGRWTTQDPIGFDAKDANLYRYVGNHPTIAADPTGLEEMQDKEAAQPEIERMKLNDAWKLVKTAVGNELTQKILNDNGFMVGNKKVPMPESIFDTPNLEKTKDDIAPGGEWFWGVSAVRIKVKDYSGPVVQVVHTTVALNFKDGKSKKDSESYKVEAFQIKDGLALAPDLHISGLLYTTEERRKMQSVVFESEFELGAACKFQKKEIQLGSAYSSLSNKEPNAGDIEWKGKRLKYKSTYTFDVVKSEGKSVYTK
jgi:hypothetical protein